MEAERLRQLEDGMMLVGKYAQRMAQDRGLGPIEVTWSYNGHLRDHPDRFTLSISIGKISQNVIFPREPIEDYPGQVGIGKTEAVVKEAIALLCDRTKPI